MLKCIFLQGVTKNHQKQQCNNPLRGLISFGSIPRSSTSLFLKQIARIFTNPELGLFVKFAALILLMPLSLLSASSLLKNQMELESMVAVRKC
jgi:hypothetical protein